MDNVIRTIADTQVAGNLRPEVRLVMSDQNWLESQAVDQLKKTTQLPGMVLGVGMPDLHPGKGQPIGAAFVTKDVIYPHLVGSDIGCGMGIWKLNIQKQKLKLDKWEKKLTGLDDAWQGNPSDWLEAHGHHVNIQTAIENGDDSTMHNGISQQEADLLNSKLGTIGGGNHFAEIQTVNEVYDGRLFTETGIQKNDVTLLVHSGSRGLGQLILRRHVDRLGATAISTAEAESYMAQHRHAVFWAGANRALIAHRFSDCLKVSSECVLDVSHNTVEPLTEDYRAALGLVDDATYWIHRKGASPTNKGLVMIPGSRGSLSYLVKPTSNIEILAQGGFSLAHGAGRKWKRSDARGRLERRFKVNDLLSTELGSRVICKSRDLLYEEAPQAYKNIDIVVNDMVRAGMVKLVASFKPVITYKTRKK